MTPPYKYLIQELAFKIHFISIYASNPSS